MRVAARALITAFSHSGGYILAFAGSSGAGMIGVCFSRIMICATDRRRNVDTKQLTQSSETHRIDRVMGGV